MIHSSFSQSHSQHDATRQLASVFFCLERAARVFAPAAATPPRLGRARDQVVERLACISVRDIFCETPRLSPAASRDLDADRNTDTDRHTHTHTECTETIGMAFLIIRTAALHCGCALMLAPSAETYAHYQNS